MKAPEMADLEEEVKKKEATDPVAQAVAVESAKASTIVRKTFSITQANQDYLVKVAADLMAETGKTVSASEALRQVIERDSARGGK